MYISRRGILSTAMLYSSMFLWGTVAFADSMLTPLSYRYLLGRTTVTIAIEDHGAGPIFVSLHDNEDTASDVARALVRAEGGMLVELEHGGDRNITFVHEDSVYMFDPNRMFSKRGIAATLKTQGKTYSESAAKIVAAFASVFLVHFEHAYGPGEKMVTVHNNTDGDYSILSYVPGGPLERDAARVHLVPTRDPDDFFLVTTKPLYEYLVGHSMNVVLQSREAVNDGSLSVYANRKKIPYVNVEAEEGHYTEQEEMLALLR